MNFKQLFCRHIWNGTDDVVELAPIVVREGPGGHRHNTYDRWAVQETCLKCGKSRLVEKRGMASKVYNYALRDFFEAQAREKEKESVK